MTRIYFGVDIGGAENTWLAAIADGANGPAVIDGPRTATFADVLTQVGKLRPLGVALDGQLSLSASDENGFRSSDNTLRTQLPADCRTWVASANSLMAVPLRAGLLAERLRPDVGTILETHPRAALFLALGDKDLPDIKSYKSKGATEAVRRLSDRWLRAFGLTCKHEIAEDGALDAVVCATIAWCFHHVPERLQFLRHDADERRGGGPFYVPRRVGADLDRQ